MHESKNSLPSVLNQPPKVYSYTCLRLTDIVCQGQRNEASDNYIRYIESALGHCKCVLSERKPQVSGIFDDQETSSRIQLAEE